MKVDSLGGGGGVATYMVTDDLVDMPLSTSALITLLQKFRIKELGDHLEEKVVNFGMDEVRIKLCICQLFLVFCITNF